MARILYIDMDNVLVDFESAVDRLAPDIRHQYTDRLDEIPRVFANMAPMPGAIESHRLLSGMFETYVLSTAP